MPQSILDAARVDLRTPLCDRLGVRYPIVQAPIGGAATPALAAAVASAGGLGMLRMTGLDPAEIHDRMAATRARTDRPFGVNLIIGDDQQAQLDACLAAGATIVSFFWRRLSRGDRYLDASHEAGALVMLTVGSAREARAAVDAGVDIVVAQGVEAGGHVWGGVGTLPLVPAVVDAVAPVPVIAAGGIGDGRGVAAVLALGAQAAWIGTRFLLADEAPVHADHAGAVIRATETDTVLTSLFDGGWPDAPHRTLVNSTVETWQTAGEPPSGLRPGEGDVVARAADGSAIRRYDVQHPTTTGVAEGSGEAMALYAGQSAGLVHERKPAAAIVADLMREARLALGVDDGP